MKTTERFLSKASLRPSLIRTPERAAGPSLTHPAVRATRFMFALLMALTASVAVAAPRDVAVKGEATYYDDGRHSRTECMRLAAEQARVDALAREFGTIIAQDFLQTDRISRGVETNDFLSLSRAEVKGEWLGDDGEPQYEFSYDRDHNLVVTCRIKGRARAISNNTVQFETLALRNGTRKGNMDSRFRDGDELYLWFNGSVDGYISVFLEDETRHVYHLLPYPRDTKSQLLLKGGREYVFFSADLGKGEMGPEEELILTAPDNVEYNRLYVIFSPNGYNPPVTTVTDGIPSLRSADFNSWMLRMRHNDPQMAVKSINLEISPRD